MERQLAELQRVQVKHERKNSLNRKLPTVCFLACENARWQLSRFT